jgi:hypothetical protein
MSVKTSLCLAILLALKPCIEAFAPQPKASFVALSNAHASSHRNNVKLAMAADPEAKKETTWDRITGPKLFKTVTNWEGIHAFPLVPLRILTGLLMIHHGSEGEFRGSVEGT